MDRLACVDLPSLALQLLVRANPDWVDHPVAVVLEDKPHGRILQVNERARAHRVLPGMKYASGLSLAPGLRAGVIEERALSEAVEALVQLLRDFSPNVEPCKDEEGVMWVDARGLNRLWASLSAWGAALADKLRDEGWHAAIVVGFSRFSTYAIARTRLRGQRRLLILGDKEAERRLCTTVALDRLGLQSKARDGLAKLGISTVGDLLKLPSAGVMRRFGPEAERLWRLAAGDRRPKMRPKAAILPVRTVLHLDHGTSKTTALLFIIKRLLASHIATLAQRHEVLVALRFDLVHESGKRRSEEIRPAEASLDEKLLVDLVRLRLDSIQLRAEVHELTVEALGCPATTAQLRMYFDRPRRDVSAGNMALARLRAELGDNAVQYAVLQAGHLPEAQFHWAPLEKMLERAALLRADTKSPDEDDTEQPRRLVRRILPVPRKLPPQSRHVRNDGWLVSGLKHGSVIRTAGPFLVSGGWWRREIHREYQYVETERGDMLWIFYDRQRRRWFQQGTVE